MGECLVLVRLLRSPAKPSGDTFHMRIDSEARSLQAVQAHTRGSLQGNPRLLDEGTKGLMIGKRMHVVQRYNVRIGEGNLCRLLHCRIIVETHILGEL